ncbi:PREDICTED: inositol-tetrakisphosphate 1-kinase 2-like isoform X2 [Tarenaya hassleriana]|uniref:inositol-tetrakisphosphate 1-kinase 2-like isoform X2 n=1 Tax=Tarenaya hassleriana TaxID=28532 RepID=UPI00053C5AE7|nr:PREDICTED: inositol-tetrakisphosphate 1-kinase 2-like isoform X2 [Tarenaya hassleriana]
MLQCVADLNLSDCDGAKIATRYQTTCQRLLDLCQSGRISIAISLAKPLLVDGTAKSHQILLAYDRFSLLELEPLLVLQEFVNHGFRGVVRRCSLRNVSNCERAKVAGVFQFLRVSSASSSPDDTDLDPRIAELPPRSLLETFVK